MISKNIWRHKIKARERKGGGGITNCTVTPDMQNTATCESLFLQENSVFSCRLIQLWIIVKVQSRKLNSYSEQLGGCYCGKISWKL